MDVKNDSLSNFFFLNIWEDVIQPGVLWSGKIVLFEYLRQNQK